MYAHCNAAAGNADQLKKFCKAIGGLSLLLGDRRILGERFEPVYTEVFDGADKDGPEASSSCADPVIPALPNLISARERHARKSAPVFKYVI